MSAWCLDRQTDRQADTLFRIDLLHRSRESCITKHKFTRKAAKKEGKKKKKKRKKEEEISKNRSVEGGTLTSLGRCVEVSPTGKISEEISNKIRPAIRAALNAFIFAIVFLVCYRTLLGLLLLSLFHSYMQSCNEQVTFISPSLSVSCLSSLSLLTQLHRCVRLNQ